MTATATPAIDMHPTAMRADLLQAAELVSVFLSWLPHIERWYAENNTTKSPFHDGTLRALEERLSARAAEFDTRSASCDTCGFRHTKQEGCDDGRL